MLKLHMQGELLEGFQTCVLDFILDFIGLRYEVLEIANFNFLGTCTRILETGYQGPYTANFTEFQRKKSKNPKTLSDVLKQFIEGNQAS